jgi:hypothetical protein
MRLNADRLIVPPINFAISAARDPNGPSPTAKPEQGRRPTSKIFITSFVDEVDSSETSRASVDLAGLPWFVATTVIDRQHLG